MPEIKPKLRIQSIDTLRGIVMIIMALDHVRDFFHVHAMDGDPTNMATTTPILFFTRWITHFCAPTFVFLSGLSAWISGQKKTKKQLSLFLIKRGVWLLFVEVAIMSLAFTFNPLYNLLLLQVIWAIGVSMIILGLLVNTSMAVIITIGVVIVLGHNILDYFIITTNSLGGWLLTVFVTGGHTMIKLSDSRFIMVFYSALPWTGIMMLGYGMGQLYNHAVYSFEARRRILLTIGSMVTLLFIVLRLVNHYGDPAPEVAQPTGVFTFLSFLNVTKYPPSLDYTCMALGPAIIVLALTEQVQNGFTRFVSVYGKVPFFYYVLHFYLIHTLEVVFFFASGYSVKDIVDINTPFLFRPYHFGFQLWAVYLIWLIVVLALYRPCKWFGNYKATHKQWWLSYL